MAVAGSILTAAAFYATGHEAEIIQGLKLTEASQAAKIEQLQGVNANLEARLYDQGETIKQDREDLKAVSYAFRFCDQHSKGFKP